MNRNYALLIGVHDYTSFDPSGGADVPGARRDAITWVRTCLSMGFSPENIRVLTSPPLSPADLGPEGGGVTLGEATHKGILDGLDWLAQALEGASPSSGLLTFSGHGDEGEHGFPVLCPSDTTPSLDGVIDMGSLRLGSSAATREQLTVLLDCCHAEAGRSAKESVRGRLQAKNTSRAVPEVARSRVIAACGREQSSVSARFLGVEMGAFTWAVASALGQWKVVVEEGVATVDVSYGDLLSRTRALLSALSFEQVPVLSGSAGVAGLSFLHPGDKGSHGETRRAPTAERKGHQLDGGQIPGGYYDIVQIEIPGLSVEQIIGFVYVTSTDASVSLPKIGSVQMLPGREYWALYSSSGDVSGVYTWWSRNYPSATALVFHVRERLSSDISVNRQYQYFQANEGTTWTSGNTTLPAVSFPFGGGTGNLKGVTLEFKDNTPTQFWWLQSGSGNLQPADLNGVSLTPRTGYPPATDYAAPSALSWFDPSR